MAVLIGAGVVVALLAEGVDRNKIDLQDTTGQTESPSSRRAWIEMALTATQKAGCGVALLAEGVDRNPLHSGSLPRMKESPSSRRAWIEIKPRAALSGYTGGRPPRGGRG